MYIDKHSVIKLSKECWDCLDEIKDVGYASAYTLYWSDNIKLIQQATRKIAPDIEGDLIRFRIEGKGMDISLSENAIMSYKIKIQEFISFGSAVRILGAYENYIKNIVEMSDQIIPQRMDDFRNKHRKHTRNVKGFIKDEMGRGIDFFQEVFNYSPHPTYKPFLKFIFRFRNVTVHNSGIADQGLVNAANSPHFNVIGQLNIGAKVYWNPPLLLELYNIMMNMLPEVDPLICLDLKLKQYKRRAFWYVGTENS